MQKSGVNVKTTFSPIPAYPPIPEIVADADEIISQQQHANAAAADTEEWKNKLQKTV
jgi:hypothetical protein